jgi:poly(3-hydroxybutyrate) depolymerase
LHRLATAANLLDLKADSAENDSGDEMRLKIERVSAALLLAAVSVWAAAGQQTQQPSPQAAPQATPQSAPQPTLLQKWIHAAHETNKCFIYIPAGVPKDKPLPLMVVVHPAGGEATGQIAAWRTVADTNQVILLAPAIGALSADWDQLYDHPEWIRAAIDETKKEHSVDGRRMYLWGDSAGGMFGFYLAFVESNYFAAAAVHGAVIRNFKFQIADFAARKIPIAYYIGTRDGWWTLQQSRSVRDALTTRGFPLHYVELNGADHNFFGHLDGVTGDAWEFLSQHALEADPRFDPIDLSKIKHALK